MSSSFLGTSTVSTSEAVTSEDQLMWASFGEHQPLKHSYYDYFMMSDRVR
jgi:hypothetical protein